MDNENKDTVFLGQKQTFLNDRPEWRTKLARMICSIPCVPAGDYVCLYEKEEQTHVVSSSHIMHLNDLKL